MTSIRETLLEKAKTIIKPLVEAVEAQPETTRNHYGVYMALLSKIIKDTPDDKKQVKLCFFMEAFVLAGANPQGVRDAGMILAKTGELHA